MRTFFRRAVFAGIVGCALAGPVSAEFQTDLLLEQEGWYAALVTQSDGPAQWCTARSASPEGHSFSINGSASHDLMIAASAPDWAFREGEALTMVLTVDGQRWAFNGEGLGSTAQVFASDNVDMPTIMDPLWRGQSVGIEIAPMGHGMTVSLSGLEPVLEAMLTCWQDLVEE